MCGIYSEKWLRTGSRADTKKTAWYSVKCDGEDNMSGFTKEIIARTFTELLEEKPMSKVTVKDIVEDCGVNRNSFYYHFQDIPSLLEEIIVEMTAKVIENLPEESTFEEKVTAALEEINLNKRMIYHIYGSSNREFYEKQLMKICDYVTRTYIRSRDYSEKVTSKDLEFVISYLKCELFGQLIDWLNHDMSYDIVEHSRILCRMFAGSMRMVCQKYKLI